MLTPGVGGCNVSNEIPRGISQPTATRQLMTSFNVKNPATNKRWTLTDLHAALLQAEAERDEALAVANQTSTLSFDDVVNRWFMPALETDRRERPLFWEDARCGLQTATRWLREARAEMQRPIFKTN